MDISAITSLYQAQPVTPTVADTTETETGFDKVLSSVMSMIQETNSLQNDASSQEISFALGESDNVHDLLIAERKATIALQYTVAIRDKFIDGYNTIMNMQI
jgi:flagellar hook-basal body complex protein FliE